jgi:hypothetical protein
LSAPNFRLKGGGWYETDFKDKNQRNLAGDSNSAGKSSDKATSSDGDKKASDKGSTSSTKAADAKPKKSD